jgi:hypothetical protein
VISDQVLCSIYSELTAVELVLVVLIVVKIIKIIHISLLPRSKGMIFPVLNLLLFICFTYDLSWLDFH